MTPKLASIGAHDLSAVFELYQLCLFPYIDEEFGWNQTWQERWFQDNYQWEHFRWINRESQRCGLVYCEERPEEIRLRLLLVWPESQSKGLGADVMQLLWQEAVSAHKPVSLSCIKCNKRAIKFYQSVGYSITDEEDHFIHLQRSATAK